MVRDVICLWAMRREYRRSMLREMRDEQKNGGRRLTSRAKPGPVMMIYISAKSLFAAHPEIAPDEHQP